MSSHHLKELNTAIQCLGIKPKAINDSCIKDTERNGIDKARYQKRNSSWKTKKTTVISYANFNLPSCNDLTMSKQNQKTLEMTARL